MRFGPGEYYHIINRGIEGRPIFTYKADYERFVKGLCEFNSPEPRELRFSNQKEQSLRKTKEKLVDVVCYCLMKNHVHFLLRVSRAERASLFLQKLFGGYTMYFNIKYQRRGVLFQGKAIAKHVNEHIYLDHVLRYIHLNPLDYGNSRWREHGVRNITRTRKYLLEYPWSSVRTAVSGENNPIISYSLLRELVPDGKEFLETMLEWSAGDLEMLRLLYGGSTSERIN